MGKTISILRQFGEWGTDLRSRYTGDIFVRTALYVVVLQIAFVLVCIVAFTWTLHYSNQMIVDAIGSHLTAILSGAAADTSPLPLSVSAIQNRLVLYVFFGIVIFAALGGILLAYITLRPARDSLHYQKLFISNVAHELRTPLSSIKTSTEVALMDETLAPALKKTFTDTVLELDRLSEIINNLLSLNRLLHPEQMDFSNVDLGPVIDSVVEHLSALSHERGIEIIVKKNDYRVVWGNTAALEQIITNLLKNAISYTPKNKAGLITVSVQPDYRGSVVCSIADNGIGIAQHDLFHIFEPFYRADNSRVRRIKKSGSGLGLAIVNEMVRVHRGKIHIQSALGKGTTVSVILPAGAAPSGELQPQVENTPLNEISVDFSRRL